MLNAQSKSQVMRNFVRSAGDKFQAATRPPQGMLTRPSVMVNKSRGTAASHTYSPIKKAY